MALLGTAAQLRWWHLTLLSSSCRLQFMPAVIDGLVDSSGINWSDIICWFMSQLMPAVICTHVKSSDIYRSDLSHQIRYKRGCPCAHPSLGSKGCGSEQTTNFVLILCTGRSRGWWASTRNIRTARRPQAKEEEPTPFCTRVTLPLGSVSSSTLAQSLALPCNHTDHCRCKVMWRSQITGDASHTWKTTSGDV
nr:uncharacterized protein LOC129382201 [Dermacentor andersoni]